MPENVQTTESPPVQGWEVLDAARRMLTRFVTFPTEEAADAVTLWIAHCWIFRAFPVTPRLAITSDQPGSGKTLLLQLISEMVPNPLLAANITAPALFLGISSMEPIVFLDETDVLFGGRGTRHEEVRGVLNAGYRYNGKVLRARGNTGQEFSVFCPVALAGIGHLPHTLKDRSIVVKMSRAVRRPEPYRPRLHDQMVRETGISVGEWARANVLQLGTDMPEPVEGVENRAAEIWEPMISVGNVAGGDWPERARTACAALVLGAGDEDSISPPPDRLLLADIARVFTGERMTTADLLDALYALSGSPWADLWPRTMAPVQLAGILGTFGIAPVPVRIGRRVARGYRREDFTAVWASEVTSVAGVTSVAA